MTGYSDRINHAFAFAAKHHDQQVRKGTRLPYFTRPANVAVILTRYGQPEGTVVAGVLHDVVEDCVRDGYTNEMLEARIASKFGADVLRTALEVTRRRQDSDGIDLSAAEQREDFLARLASVPREALWVVAADELHHAASLLADLQRTEFPESVWGRFGAGREATIRGFREMHDRLRAAGFAEPIMAELGDVVGRLELFSRPETSRTDAAGAATGGRPTPRP